MHVGHLRAAPAGRRLGGGCGATGPHSLGSRPQGRALLRPAGACWLAARLPTCANAVSTVCTTLDEVQVMVGTARWASALVFRLVLM